MNNMIFNNKLTELTNLLTKAAELAKELELAEAEEYENAFKAGNTPEERMELSTPFANNQDACKSVAKTAAKLATKIKARKGHKATAKKETTGKSTDRTFCYRIFDSMGKRTEVVYHARNFAEALQKFAADAPNARMYCHGKLKREYDHGVGGDGWGFGGNF